ncbi:MAG: hypothetical protein GY832_03845 [Chloroflexi bacterium]|nr:hypothetical protein [Chloroflexota bacterium]
MDAGVFASLEGEADTTIETAGVYYPINGIFINSPVASFAIVDDPGIQFTDGAPRWFEIDWHATVKVAQRDTLLHIGLKHNGLVQVKSEMCVSIKLIDHNVTLSGTCAVYLADGDVIQLVVTSESDGDVVTFVHFTTTIRELFS